MKRTLSIILTVVMLSSMIIAAIPTGAATVNNEFLASSTPTYDESTVGNTMAGKDNTAYKQELAAQGYIPIVNSIRAGVTPSNAVCLTPGVKLSNGTEEGLEKKYYLWEDITYSEIKNWGNKYVIIDGAGHTLTMTVESLYTELTNITLKNITIFKETPVEVDPDSAAVRPTILNRYTNGFNKGYTRLENVTLDVDYTVIKNTMAQYSFATLTDVLNPGSYLKNVLNLSTLTLAETVVPPEAKKMSAANRLGALVCTARGTEENPVTFENVVNRGAINISDGVTLTHCNYIGGMAALTTGSVTFKNCFNEGDINIGHNASLGYWNGPASIGGLVGEAEAGTKFINCVNSGSITIGDDTKSGNISVVVSSIGGIVGKVTGESTSTYALENCVNKAEIKVSKNVIINDNHSVAKDKKFGCAGIAGKMSGMIAIKDCTNEGAITFGGKTSYSGKGAYVGGIFGYASDGAVLEDCQNAASILANGDNQISITYSINSQTLTGKVYTSTYVGGIAGGVGGLGEKVSKFTDCTNKGSMTVDEAGVTALGGIIGLLCEELDHKLTNCDNKGTIKFQNGGSLNQPSDNGMGIGGVLGLSRATRVSLSKCDNTADITFFVKQAPKSDQEYKDANGNIGYYYFHTGTCGVGGVMGYQYLTGAQTLNIENCKNSGKLASAAAPTGVYSRAPALGGVVGGVRGVKNVLIYGCENAGALTLNIEAGFCSSIGGIMGHYASIGNWMTGGDTQVNATIDFRGCVNSGTIQGKVIAGGILGANSEMEAVNLVTSFYNCINTGNIIVTESGCNAAGIYGHPQTKGILKFEYCVNKGTVSSKATSGGIASYSEGIKEFIAKNCKNEGAVTADATSAPRAGGIVARISASTKVEILNSANTGEIVSKGSTEQAYAAGIAGNISGVTANINNCINKGTVKCDSTEYKAPITINTVTLASGGNNYYLANSVTGTTINHGTSMAQSQIDSKINAIEFSSKSDPYYLNQTIDVASKLVKGDYEAAGWTALSNALNNAKTVAGNKASSQTQIDSAKATLENAMLGLVIKALDLSGFNAVKTKYEAVLANIGYWNTTQVFTLVDNFGLLEAMAAETGILQSEFDAAVAAINTYITNLKPSKVEGDIDVDENGDFTIATLRPSGSKTTQQTEETEESTTNTSASTSGTLADKEGGCGGIIGGAAVVLTAVLALGAGVSLRKKED